MARSFDGSADYLSASSAAITAYGYSMAAWFKTSSFASSNYFFQFGNTGNADNRAGINFISTGALECSVRNAAATRTWRTTATASTGTWVHAVGTFTSTSTITAYLNGNGAGSYPAATSATWPTFNTTSIGALRRSSLLYALGDVAECAVWSAVLSNAEIDQLANGYCPLLVRPQSLVNYWPLHGRAGAAGDEEDWFGSLAMAQTSSPGVVDHPRIIYPRRQQIIMPPAATGYTHPTLSAATATEITAAGFKPRVTYTFA